MQRRGNSASSSSSLDGEESSSRVRIPRRNKRLPPLFAHREATGGTSPTTAGSPSSFPATAKGSSHTQRSPVTRRPITVESNLNTGPSFVFGPTPTESAPLLPKIAATKRPGTGGGSNLKGSGNSRNASAKNANTAHGNSSSTTGKNSSSSRTQSNKAIGTNTTPSKTANSKSASANNKARKNSMASDIDAKAHHLNSNPNHPQLGHASTTTVSESYATYMNLSNVEADDNRSGSDATSGGGTRTYTNSDTDERSNANNTNNNFPFDASEVWKSKKQSPKNFSQYVSLFHLSWKNQSTWHFFLSFMFHAFHIFLALSLIFSPILARSVFFSSAYKSKDLLQAQGLYVPKKGVNSNNNNKTAPTEVSYSIENIWSIHDSTFFLEPGNTIIKADISESFQKLPTTKKKKHVGQNAIDNEGGAAGNGGSGKDANAADDDDAEEGTAHTYVTTKKKKKDEEEEVALLVNGENDDGVSSTARPLQNKKKPANTTINTKEPTNKAAAGEDANENVNFLSGSPPPLPGNANHWKGKKSKGSASLKKIAASWESSPIYSSPMSISIYYYFYLIACVVFLAVGSEGRFTGHFSVLRFIVCIAELIWYHHHGAHSFLIYSWLFLLSHWHDSVNHRIPSKTPFLSKGTPYLRVHDTDGTATLRLFYKVKDAKDGVNGVPLQDEALNMDTYLYSKTSMFYTLSIFLDVMFVTILLLCSVSDLQRILDAIMGVRDLWEPDGFVRCPLCGELLERENVPWYRSIQIWMASLMCDGGFRISAESRKIVRLYKYQKKQEAILEKMSKKALSSGYTQIGDDHLSDPFYTANRLEYSRNNGGSGADRPSLSASVKTDSSEEDLNEGGIVKVIVQSNTRNSVTELKKKRAAERLLMHHSTRHVCHRCPKLFLDVESSEEEENTDSDNTENSSSEEEDDRMESGPPSAGLRARSPPRRMVPEMIDNVRTGGGGFARIRGSGTFVQTPTEDNDSAAKMFPSSADGLPSALSLPNTMTDENFNFNFSFSKANYGTMHQEERVVRAVVDRGNDDAIKDAEDEFRPGNAFASYDKAGWFSRITYSWLNPLLKFALLEPTLLRHERFLPALPADLTAFDNISISIWQYWLHRKLWFAQYAAKTGDALIPSEEAVDRAEEYLNLGDLTLNKEEDEEDEEAQSSANMTVIILEPKQLKNSKLRSKQPHRSFTERSIMALTAPFRYFGRKLFFAVYIRSSHTIKRTRERLVRALLKDRLLALHEETGGLNGVVEDGLWALAEMASSEGESTLNSAGSILPSNMRRHLALRDVSLFYIFMEHPIGRRYLYVAGPLLLLYDIGSLLLVPIVGKICFCIAFQPQYLDGFGTDHDLDGSNGVYTGLKWCLLLFALLTLQSVVYQEYWSVVNKCALEVRTAVSTLVLEKVMNLSLAQCAFSENDVINLITRESARVCESLLTLHHTWSNPFLVFAIMGYLFYYLGVVSAVASFIVVSCVVPATRYTASRVRLAHHEVPSSSVRTSLITDALSDMRQVKAFLMETFFVSNVKKNCKEEAKGEIKVSLWIGVTKMLSEASFTFLVLASFGTHAYLGGDLTPTTLLPALAALALLWTPISEFPSLFSNVSRGYLSMKRIEAVMRQSPDQFVGTWVDLTADQPFKRPYRRGSIVCKGCSFTWDHDLCQGDPQPVLNDVRMKILPGELAVVQGSLDSPRDALLLAILGEINRCIDSEDYNERFGYDDTVSEFSVVSHNSEASSSGRFFGSPHRTSPLHSKHVSPSPHPVDCESDEDAEIKPTDGFLVFGSCVYCPATPWLQNDTIRSNITSGKMVSSFQTNKHWYSTVVRACALDKDFATLIDGDQTVIGDKGTQLTMGQKSRIALARALFAKADIYLLDSVLSYQDEATRQHIIREVFQKILRNKTVVLVSNVGLAQLQPHKIFTVTDDGDVRDDTTLYMEVQSDKDSVASSNETRQSVEADDGEDYGHNQDNDNSSNADTEAYLGNASMLSDPARNLPVLFAEEYEEAEVALNIRPGVINEDDEDFEFDPLVRSSDENDIGETPSSSSLSEFGDTGAESIDQGSAESGSGKTDSEADPFASEGSVEDSAAGGKTRGAVGQRRLRSEEESFRVFATFMGKQGLWLLLAAIVQQLLHISMDVWLAYWLAISRWNSEWATPYAFFVVFVILGVCSSLFYIPGVRLRFKVVRGAIRRVYVFAFESVLRAPVSFFDLRTSASITNTLTKDMEVISYHLPESVEIILSCAAQLFVIVLFNCVINPAFLLILPITVLLFLSVSQRFTVVSREVRRLENKSLSGTVAILKEVIQGAAMVRCFSMQDRFREEFCRSLDTTNTATMIAYMVDRWVSLRLQLIMVIMVTASASFGVLMSTPLATPSFVGIAIITCLRSGRIFTALCRRYAHFKGHWVLMQDMIDLLLVPTEPLTPAQGSSNDASEDNLSLSEFSPNFYAFGKAKVNENIFEARQVSINSPIIHLLPDRESSEYLTRKETESNDSFNSCGMIVSPILELVDVSACYHPSLPLALRHANLSVYPKERIGFVGRAGQGKSTIFNVLLRLIHLEEGGIFLNGENANKVPYPILRSWFATVPQDPLLLMTGTWRENLLIGFGKEPQTRPLPLSSEAHLFALPSAAASANHPMNQSIGADSNGDDEVVFASTAHLWQGFSSGGGSGGRHRTSSAGPSGIHGSRKGSQRPSPRLGAVQERSAGDFALWEALEAVGLSNHVEELGGLDAPLVDDDDDCMMSANHAQLLCLARAVLRKPPFILLDDPATTGGDLQTDKVIKRVLQNELKDSTAFIIAHRVNTVLQLCSRVVLIKDGTIDTIIDGGERQQQQQHSNSNNNNINNSNANEDKSNPPPGMNVSGSNNTHLYVSSNNQSNMNNTTTNTNNNNNNHNHNNNASLGSRDMLSSRDVSMSRSSRTPALGTNSEIIRNPLTKEKIQSIISYIE